MNTLLLDTSTWDLLVDASGNIAVASEPYALAQDAASAIRTFQGECWYDTLLGVPYWTYVLGLYPSLSLLKQLFINAALTVPDVASAVVYVSSFVNRAFAGQVQIVSASGEAAATNFGTLPQAPPQPPGPGELNFAQDGNTQYLPGLPLAGF